MSIAHLVMQILSSVRSGMPCFQHIPLLKELETVDDGQSINISLLTELSISLRLRRSHVSIRRRRELKKLLGLDGRSQHSRSNVSVDFSRQAPTVLSGQLIQPTSALKLIRPPHDPTRRVRRFPGDTSPRLSRAARRSGRASSRARRKSSYKRPPRAAR
jgi:hypothetical protein